MNTFWDQQEQARARTGRLLFVFALAVIGVVLAVYLPLVILFNLTDLSFNSLEWLWSPRLFLWTAGPIMLIIAIGALIERSRLSGGGAALARQLKARPVETSGSRQERVLVNVVEEMAIASGIQPPSIFILDRAPDSINALVAGNTIGDAAIIVTMGCLDQLSRDELQAVVAHEFSHIFNGDMRLNLHAMALVAGILALAIIGFEIMIPDEGFGCLTVVLGLPFVLLGGIGTGFASMLQKSISREREYLADASAVQFTRNPEALIGAMAKIESGSSRIKRVAFARAADHLFFADSRRRAWIPFFRTHPPLPERRRRIGHLVVEGSREESPFAVGLRDKEPVQSGPAAIP